MSTSPVLSRLAPPPSQEAIPPSKQASEPPSSTASASAIARYLEHLKKKDLWVDLHFSFLQIAHNSIFYFLITSSENKKEVLFTRFFNFFDFMMHDCDDPSKRIEAIDDFFRDLQTVKSEDEKRHLFLAELPHIKEIFTLCPLEDLKRISGDFLAEEEKLTIGTSSRLYVYLGSLFDFINKAHCLSLRHDSNDEQSNNRPIFTDGLFKKDLSYQTFLSLLSLPPSTGPKVYFDIAKTIRALYVKILTKFTNFHEIFEQDLFHDLQPTCKDLALAPCFNFLSGDPKAIYEFDFQDLSKNADKIDGLLTRFQHFKDWIDKETSEIIELCSVLGNYYLFLRLEKKEVIEELLTNTSSPRYFCKEFIKCVLAFVNRAEKDPTLKAACLSTLKKTDFLNDWSYYRVLSKRQRVLGGFFRGALTIPLSSFSQLKNSLEKDPFLPHHLLTGKKCTLAPPSVLIHS
ncbi:MAG: hypothetical protein ACM3JI_04005, partial [Anaerolineae bacterium]